MYINKDALIEGYVIDCGVQSHVTYCKDYTNPLLAKCKLGSLLK